MTGSSLRRRALINIIALPVFVLTGLPAIILWWSNSFRPGWGLLGWTAYLPGIAGVFSLAVGVALIAATARLFTSLGEGTLAPWDPPKNLVVAGPYRYVRNPMHSGLFLALYGEGLLTGSLPLLLFVTAVFVFHWFYIPLIEERWLTARFGQDYLSYRRKVPAWIPRITPWQPGGQS